MAKQLDKKKPNTAYIGTRHYRAPELLLGARQYTTTVDIWAAACVVVEMLTGQVLFNGAKDAQLDIVMQVGSLC